MPRIVELIDPTGEVFATAPEALRRLLSGFHVGSFDRTSPFKVRFSHVGSWAFSFSQGGGHLDIARRPDSDEPHGYLMLIMVGSGLVEAHTATRYRPLLARSGEAALYRPDALPDALHFAGSLRNMVIFLPEEGFADLPIATPISTDTGLGAVLSSTVRTVASQSMLGWSEAMVGALPGLAMLVRQAFMQSAVPEASPREGRDGRLLRLQDFIHHHIDDPGLDAARAARACGLSLRQLHRIFERSGTSFAAEVRVQRMGRASALLDSSPPETTIAQIAAAAGFADAAYFATMFRRHSGMSPSQYRKRHDPRPDPCRQRLAAP